MDLDIEMGDAAEASHDAPIADLHPADDIMQPDELDEPGEVADDRPQADNDATQAMVPTKVHVRGLDTLHTDDVKAYVRAHFGPVDKVEWIDDTSANLVFGSEPTAREAIAALSSIEVVDATALAVGETLPAKPVQGRPQVSLQVRFALQSDKKPAGAALRSRYYLLHPEHDPEERRRRRLLLPQHQQETRARYRDRDGHNSQDGRRRRESDGEGEPFEASMYDDAPQPPSRPRRFSDSQDGPRPPFRENRGKELFAHRTTRRDRSASPRRAGLGHGPADSLASSSRNNKAHARSLKGRLSADNSAKELFPTRTTCRGGQLDQLEHSIGSASLQEDDMPKIVATPDAPLGSFFNIRGLASQRRGSEAGFAIKGAATSTKKELFPDKLGSSSNAGKELLDATSRNKSRRKAHDLFS